MSSDTIKVAVVQATSTLFDLEATLDHGIDQLKAAAEKGAQLVLFPEAFLGGYPRGLDFGAVVGSRTTAGRQLWQRYWDSAFDPFEGEAKIRLEEAIREAGVYVGIGVVERNRLNRTLYCSLLYYNPSGKLLGVHRKLKPTGSERIIWGEGSGKDLITVDSSIGRLGGLICWENMMPLARMAMYQQGVEIYLIPTADGRLNWASVMTHIALEGRCFVLSANQYQTIEDLPTEFHSKVETERTLSRGGSMIISPAGEVLAGPLWDKQGILYADLDFDLITQSRMDFEANGHYNRPDVFDLKVLGQPMPIIDK